MKTRSMILAVLLVIAGWSAACAPNQGNRQTDNPAPSLKIDLHMGLRSLLSLSEAHIFSVLSSLRAAAVTQEVRSGDWNRMRDLLVEIMKDQIPLIVLYIRPDGSYYNSEAGLTDKNIKDRPYFARLLAGQEVIGELVVSRSTGKKASVLAVPLMKDGKFVGAIGASIFLDQLCDRLIKEIALPGNMVFYALNDQGETALHSDTKWLLEEPEKMRSETLTASVKTILAEKEGMTSYEFEGRVKTVEFATSSLTGWHFALGFATLK